MWDGLQKGYLKILNFRNYITRVERVKSQRPYEKTNKAGPVD